MLSRAFTLPLTLLTSVAIFSCAVVVAATDVQTLVDDLSTLPFDEFVDASYGEIVRLDPDTRWAWGVADSYGFDDMGEWTDVSLDALAERSALALSILDVLESFGQDELTRDQRVTFEAYAWLLADLIRSAEYPYWGYVIGMSSYGVHNLAFDVLGSLPLESEPDARAYIQRIEDVDEWMEQLIVVYRAREADGVLPTEFGIDMTLMDLDATCPLDDQGGCRATSLVAYTDFANRLSTSIPAATRSALRAELRQAIEGNLIPAFRAFREYVASLSGRSTSVGVSDYAGSAEYYGFLLVHHVTKQITADEIHAIGLREVERLQTEMKAYATGVLGWPAGMTMAELEDRIIRENQPILEGNALLAEYQGYIDEVAQLLPDYFGTLPTADLVIAVELDGPPAYYREPPVDGSGPGEIVTSLVNLVPFTTYDEPVLMHHEGVPGHHLQLALARDLDLPDFRRDLLSNVYLRHPLFQAFTEGWALYGEHLAAEMGVYEDDPFAGLCQKRLMLTRIVRLVVDSGLNALGWSWRQAVDYIQEATGQTTRDSRQLHFDAYPGQMCGYNMGYLTILELRRRAMDTLGDAFDIKAFHDAVLLRGAIPLSTLEWVVEEWIEETQSGL